MATLDYQLLVEAAPTAMCLVDTDGKLLFANPAFRELLKLSEPESQDISISQLIAPDWYEANRTKMKLLLQEESLASQVHDYPFICSNGDTLWLTESRRAIKDKTHGQLIICQYNNIDERLKKEQRLKQIEERFNLSQRHANYGVWDWNIQTNDLYWSDQIGPLIGLGDGENEANYEDFVNSIHPDDREFVGEAVRAAVEDGSEYDIVHRSVYPDGTVRWLRETGDVIRADDGTPLNMIGVARDVTEHHLANEALKESAKQLNVAQAIAHVGHWSWDVATGKLFWSDEIYRIFGHNPGEFEPTYEKFIATLHPDDVERIKQSEKEAFANGKAHSIDHRIIHPDGSEAWVHEEAVAVLDNSGKAIKMTGTVQDITQRKQLEQQLADKIAQAESANFAKSTFLSHMSHELRTPLNGILGFAQLMEMENLPEAPDNFVREIIKSGWHLLDLVDDLLDLSRIETGAIDLQLETVNLCELIRECHSMINPLLSERRLSFTASFDECAHYIQADPRRLKQIIINLLSNAIKYNRPNGSIEVSCTTHHDQLRVHIKDTGQGIPEALMHRLFTPFDRLGKEGIEESGTGIGLTLVKRLTETMGGDIGVESTEGVGSTFWVEFALAPADHQISEQTQNYNNENILMTQGNINVLYVEDNPANLRLIEGFIEKKDNINLLAANTACSGLSLAKKHQPDLILMDIKLPDMSGFEALARLKTIPETADIPVIALSAVAHEHDIAAGLNAGFYRYLTKPVNLKQLEEAMYFALNQNTSLHKENISSYSG
ncbi:MAG: PAS domain-containing protein [Gammaproteobacteria bacterium]|nr:PAS domain-containing protein [Gammaproteobacteria bacterium]